MPAPLQRVDSMDRRMDETLASVPRDILLGTGTPVSAYDRSRPSTGGSARSSRRLSLSLSPAVGERDSLPHASLPRGSTPISHSLDSIDSYLDGQMAVQGRGGEREREGEGSEDEWESVSISRTTSKESDVLGNPFPPANSPRRSSIASRGLHFFDTDAYMEEEGGGGRERERGREGERERYHVSTPMSAPAENTQVHRAVREPDPVEEVVFQELGVTKMAQLRRKTPRHKEKEEEKKEKKKEVEREQERVVERDKEREREAVETGCQTEIETETPPSPSVHSEIEECIEGVDEGIEGVDGESLDEVVETVVEEEEEEDSVDTSGASQTPQTSHTSHPPSSMASFSSCVPMHGAESIRCQTRPAVHASSSASIDKLEEAASPSSASPPSSPGVAKEEYPLSPSTPLSEGEREVEVQPVVGDVSPAGASVAATPLYAPCVYEGGAEGETIPSEGERGPATPSSILEREVERETASIPEGEREREREAAPPSQRVSLSAPHIGARRRDRERGREEKASTRGLSDIQVVSDNEGERDPRREREREREEPSTDTPSEREREVLMQPLPLPLSPGAPLGSPSLSLPRPYRSPSTRTSGPKSSRRPTLRTVGGPRRTRVAVERERERERGREKERQTAGGGRRASLPVYSPRPSLPSTHLHSPSALSASTHGTLSASNSAGSRLYSIPRAAVGIDKAERQTPSPIPVPPSPPPPSARGELSSAERERRQLIMAQTPPAHLPKVSRHSRDGRRGSSGSRNTTARGSLSPVYPWFPVPGVPMVPGLPLGSPTHTSHTHTVHHSAHSPQSTPHSRKMVLRVDEVLSSEDTQKETALQPRIFNHTASAPLTSCLVGGQSPVMKHMSQRARDREARALEGSTPGQVSVGSPSGSPRTPRSRRHKAKSPASKRLGSLTVDSFYLRSECSGTWPLPPESRDRSQGKVCVNLPNTLESCQEIVPN
ncbi:hypothetical protein KIPB_005798 [Kipferlia bialata]|uniref:Uncharacterized protein n=1 Tax=Kipferlia bialata TaxID=797122 RepID=A0A9K3GJB7_9EUKA|nr:hypothetical protein KIPB_005798 [Kipferlia bialata]|eukprot:g5798.t1